MSGGLSSLVYRADGVASSRDYVRVVLDSSSGTPLPTQGLRGMLAGWRDGVAYDVRVDEWVDLNDMDREVRLFVTQERVTLRFSLRLMVPRAKAAQVASFFHDRVSSPPELLLHVIATAIIERAELGADYASHNLVQRIGADRDAWEDAIAQAIGDATGLVVQFRFDLGVLPLSFPEVRLRDLDVQVSDAPHRRERVHVHVVLEPTPERARDRLSSDPSDLRRRVEEVVRAAFRDRIVLFECWFDQPAVEATLKAAVDLAFRRAGHRCRKAQLEPILPPQPLEEHVECKVPWRGPSGREIKFYVEASLRLSRDGTGRYTGLNLKSRGEWFADQARRVIDIVMAGRDFWTLSKEQYDKFHAEVARDLAAAAKSTGQEMQALVAEPLIPENRWLKTQRVELTGESFKTRNGLDLAEFDVMLDVQFPSIQPLISTILHDRKLAPGASDFNGAIEGAIRDVVRDAVTSVMFEVQLTDYIVGWDHWEEAQGDAALSVPARTGHIPVAISDAIKRALTERFKATHCKVRLRREDRKLNALARDIDALGRLTVSFEASPRGMTARTQAIPITFVCLPQGPDLARLNRTLLQGARALNRPNIEATLKAAARQFLLGLDAKQIRILAHGRPAPGNGADGAGLGSFYVQLEEYLATACVEAHGFPVRLVDVFPGESDHEAVRLEREGLSDEKARLENANAREESEAALKMERLHRAKSYVLQERGYDEMLNNRRETNDERIHFQETKDRVARDRAAAAARLRPDAPDTALNAPNGASSPRAGGEAQSPPSAGGESTSPPPAGGEAQSPPPAGEALSAPPRVPPQPPRRKPDGSV